MFFDNNSGVRYVACAVNKSVLQSTDTRLLETCIYVWPTAEFGTEHSIIILIYIIMIMVKSSNNNNKKIIIIIIKKC